MEITLFVSTYFRWGKDDPLSFLAMRLDPRIKTLSMLPESERKLVQEVTKAKLIELHNNRQPAPVNIVATECESPAKRQKLGLFNFLNCEDIQQNSSLECELSLYDTLPLCSFDENPLLWWKQHQNMFPSLSFLARRYLTIPATSVPCERVFSTAGNVITQKRSSLIGANAEALIMMAQNFHENGVL